MAATAHMRACSKLVKARDCSRDSGVTCCTHSAVLMNSRRKSSTAGYVAATATPAVGEVVGVAINASSNNTVDVWVLPAKVLS